MPQVAGHSRKAHGRAKAARVTRHKPATNVRRTEHHTEIVVESTDRFLRNVCGGDLDMHSKAISDRLTAGAIKFSKDSREHHHQSVALAYALYIYDSNNDWIVANALREDLALPEMKHRANYDPVRFYLERLISYGTDEKGRSHRRADWFYARDARAVRYLMQTGVGPDELCAKAQEPNEGLDAWSRRHVAHASSSDASGTNLLPAAAGNVEELAPLFQITLGGRILMSERETHEQDYWDALVEMISVFLDESRAP